MNDLLNLIYSFFIISSKYFFITYYSFSLIRISNNNFISFIFKLISWFTSLRLNNNSFFNIVSNTFFKSFNHLNISFFITFKFIFSFRIVKSVFYIQFIPINMSCFMSVTYITTLFINLSILTHPVTVSFSYIFSSVIIYVHSPNIDLMFSPFF